VGRAALCGLEINFVLQVRSSGFGCHNRFLRPRCFLSSCFSAVVKQRLWFTLQIRQYPVGSLLGSSRPNWCVDLVSILLSPIHSPPAANSISAARAAAGVSFCQCSSISFLQLRSFHVQLMFDFVCVLRLEFS
jgi:hypothetical protein